MEEPSPKSPRPASWRLLLGATVAAGLLYGLVNVVWGPLNQDEGWYLLAAKNTAAGRMPYRDFFFTQGPFMPYVYGLLSFVWAPLGVLGGRLLTFAFGFLAALLAADTARRCQPGKAASRTAFLVTFLLLALSPDYGYFTAIPKTYALGAFCLCGGTWLLARRKPVAFLSGALFAAAAATRATLCLAAVPIWIFLILERRRDGWRFAWLRFAVGCALLLALLYVPILAICPDSFLFAQTYHTAREGAGLAGWLMLRAGFLSLLAQGYLPMVCMAAILFAFSGRAMTPVAESAAENPVHKALSLAVLASGLAVSAAHFLVPFPYNDYNTPAMPLLAVFLGNGIGRLTGDRFGESVRIGWAALVACLVFAAASPLCMKWVGGSQHLFWFSTDAKPQICKLRAAGAWIRANTAPGEPIFTQDAYLAVEADRPVVSGLEMGPFCLFPGLSDEEALSRHVHNYATLGATLSVTTARIAATSGYAFALQCPSTDPVPEEMRQLFEELLEARFGAPVWSMESFGQNRTPLLVYVRNE